MQRRNRCGLDYTIYDVETVVHGPVSPDNLVLTGWSHWAPVDEMQTRIWKLSQILVDNPAIDAYLGYDDLLQLVDKYGHQLVSYGIEHGEFPTTWDWQMMCLNPEDADKELKKLCQFISKGKCAAFILALISSAGLYLAYLVWQ